jgi:hypothetical protein
MYLIKKLSILSLLFLAVSCYQPKTHGTFLSEHKNVWIDGYAIKIHEHEEADRGLVFCRANIQEDGEAKPVCVQASFEKGEESEED